MSADTLRAAAALMRERAKAAVFTADPWAVDEVGSVWAQEADGQPVLISRNSADQDAEHIASWHPAVALAVADLLTAFSIMPSASNPTDMAVALHLAETYLGAPS